jgi:hypothetical protein
MTDLDADSTASLEPSWMLVVKISNVFVVSSQPKVFVQTDPHWYRLHRTTIRRWPRATLSASESRPRSTMLAMLVLYAKVGDPLLQKRLPSRMLGADSDAACE